MKKALGSKLSNFSFIEKLKLRNHQKRFLIKYCPAETKPGYFTLIYTLLLTAPTKRNFFKFTPHRAILRQWRAYRFPTDLASHHGNLPTIEILTVVAGKDLNLLPFSLTSAIENTLNPVSRITVIIPAIDEELCKGIVATLNINCEIQIKIEDEILDLDTRSKLKHKFGKRYGWVLQQLLADEHIIRSESNGVLLLNADTILMRKAAWLEADGTQKLLVALEYHEPYYKLLNKLIGSRKSPTTTHVTHHMLFQPSYFREIFYNFKIGDVKNLADWIISNSDPKAESPLCVEFELYAQGMLNLYPKKIQLRKFSNTSVERSDFSTSVNLYLEYSKYNSISMHSYLEQESYS
jgi:hypothetical protein